MERQKEVIQNFAMSFARFMEIVEMILKFFELDMLDFTTFDLSYNADHLAAVNLKKQQAYDQPRDDYLIDVQVEKTNEAENARKECTNCAQTEKHFVKKISVDKPSRMGQFGYNDYMKVRNSQSGMIIFLDNFYDRCIQYQPELIAAGSTVERIEKVKVLADKLRDANKDQEAFKKDRIMFTNDRIRVYNELWAMIVDIADVGKIIYADNYGKYQRYVIYGSGSGTHSNILQGTVPADNTITIMDNVTPSTIFTLKNTGTTVLQFCLEDSHNPCTEGVELNPEEEQEIIAGELGAGAILKCTNKSETTEGTYEVEVA
ncbi:MAG: hypothetical protein H8E57_01760 [Candidatus Cloacimonetes bacterium]|nr:hypothetical protein [Candidatus Cloacimonadota bacterium]